MKKIPLVVIITFLIINFAHAQTGWIDYSIDNTLSVKLPVQPKILSKNTILAVAKDSLTCLVTKIDFLSTVQLDAGALAPLLPTQEFANEIRSTLLAQIPGFSLGEIKIGKWKNYYCYNIEGGNVKKKLKLYTFIVIIDTNMYSLTAIMPDTLSPGEKDDFFASLVLH
jgi:hypothetical protein